MSESAKTISPLLTIGDDGSPSDSCLNDAKRIFKLIIDERHLCAHDLYVDLKERLEQPVDHPSPKRKLKFLKSSSPRKRRKDAEAAKALLESKKETIKKLQVSSKLVFAFKKSSDWICGAQLPPMIMIC